jgi:hypothetical protein
VVIVRVGRDFVEAVMGEGRSVLVSLDGVAAVQSRRRGAPGTAP